MNDRAGADGRSQGRKANDAGRSSDNTVREHLATHAALTGCGATNLRDYLSTGVGGLYGGRGDFAQDVWIAEGGVFARPFFAHFAVRRRDWPHPLLLFVHSQNDSGTAENAVLRFLINLYTHKKTPGVILLHGERWEQPGSAEAVAWVRDWTRRRPGVLLHVFVGLAEFRAWINDGMPWPEARQQSFA
jgi:hypothetical protein